MVNPQQIANIVQIVTQLLKENDIHTNGNIVGDKTIYAKGGLYIKDFNPNYDFFINGRSCIQGDLIIKGNLYYEDNGSTLDKTFLDVIAKPNKSSGFRVRDDVSAKGLIWDSQEEEFVIADEQYIESIKPRQNINLHNIRFKNINFNNGYCKNVLIEKGIMAMNDKIKVEGDVNLIGSISINGELKFAKDVVNIKSQLITKTIKIEGSLFVEGNVEFQKSLNAQNIHTNNIDCSDINCNRIQLEGDFITKSNCEIGGYFIATRGAEFKAGLEVKGNLYLGQALVFTGEETGIAFNKLSTIENASVNYINMKKISTFGDVMVTEAPQTMTNKSLGSNLDAQYNKIVNVDHPKDAYDAVNKKYVDQFVLGSYVIEPVKLVADVNLEGVFMASQYQLVSKEMEKLVVDKIETNMGDRILLQNQKNAAENGVYIVVSKGHRNQQWILQLSDDYKDIIKNRPNITPMVMSRYGEKNAKKLFGVNHINNLVWEIMENDDFIKKNWSIYEKLLIENKELKERIAVIEEKIVNLK